MNGEDDKTQNSLHHCENATEEHEPVFYHNTRELGRIVSNSSSSSSGRVAAADEDDERSGERMMMRTALFDYLVMLNYTLSKCTRKLWSLCTCVIAIAYMCVAHTLCESMCVCF